MSRLCRRTAPGAPTWEVPVGTYDEGEASEILTRAAAKMPGAEFDPARKAAAAALVQALHGLSGKAGVTVKKAPEGSGVIVAMRGTEGTTRAVWVGVDEGAIFVKPTNRMGQGDKFTQVNGLRLNTDQSQLEAEAL